MDCFTPLLKTLSGFPITCKLNPDHCPQGCTWSAPGYPTALTFCHSFLCPPHSSHIGFLVGSQSLNIPSLTCLHLLCSLLTCEAHSLTSVPCPGVTSPEWASLGTLAIVSSSLTSPLPYFIYFHRNSTPDIIIFSYLLVQLFFSVFPMKTGL